MLMVVLFLWTLLGFAVFGECIDVFAPKWKRVLLFTLCGPAVWLFVLVVFIIHFLISFFENLG